MIRRTRPKKEIPFSFDSFLDVIANVVGIIIKLILVVWVGARSYSSIKPVVAPSRPTSASPAETAPLPEDPLQSQLAKNRLDLERIQARILEQLRDLQITEEQEKSTEGRLDALTVHARGLNLEEAGVTRAVLERRQAFQGAGLTLASLEERRKKLTAEILAVEKLPPLKKVLRYRTPVSQPLKTDEFFFECREGRVTFIDIASLKAMAEQEVAQKLEQLRSNRELEGTTIAEGAFRLRYILKVQGDAASHAEVQSVMSVEPMQQTRGETAAAALVAGSQFHQIVDRLDTKLAAVTFWVYPDSFALYRELRDYLYEKDVVVAGRALPEGHPITLSTHGGSASRGQ